MVHFNALFPLLLNSYLTFIDNEIKKIEVKNMPAIKKILISVSDKTGIVEFAKELAEFPLKFLSTGGTARILREAGLDIMDVSEYTGFPEMMDGRIKTLHPKIHGGILGVRKNPEHLATMKKHGIEEIDMVVVNLYPFKNAIAKKGSTLKDAIENIDIGGPTMLRSAAKNYESVSVLIDPSDYQSIIAEMKKNNGEISEKTNYRLAVKVFNKTSEYDKMIAEYLNDRL